MRRVVLEYKGHNNEYTRIPFMLDAMEQVICAGKSKFSNLYGFFKQSSIAFPYICVIRIALSLLNFKNIFYLLSAYPNTRSYICIIISSWSRLLHPCLGHAFNRPACLHSTTLSCLQRSHTSCVCLRLSHWTHGPTGCSHGYQGRTPPLYVLATIFPLEILMP